MHKSYPFILLSALLTLTGCSTLSPSRHAIDEARTMILENKAECVIVRDGKIAAVERGHGVSPLLRLYETQAPNMKDGILVDKVIGRAAAFIALKAGIVQVHGELFSVDAAELLKQHNIPYTYTRMVYRILNPKRDGLCPLESSVLDIDDPDQALDAIRCRIDELRAAAAKAK